MKKFTAWCLVLALVVTLGCGKKEQETRKPVSKAKRMSLVDPVSRNKIDPEKSEFYYVYEETEYIFENKENMEAFIQDPEKYLKKDQLEEEE